MSVTLVHAGATAGTYTTMAAAVAASHDGDTVELAAGTYLNDFVNVTTQITIEGVGGMAHLVATTFPDNGRAILRTTTNVTLQNLDISGATDLNGNGSAILHVGGNLTVNDCYIHDNQEGLLSGPDVSAIGTITINNSEFDHNGDGSGYTHNIYVNNNTLVAGAPPDTLLIENSYIHDAVIGHEVKSLTDTTTIINSVLADGLSGTGSYVIDVPNGGTVSLTGDIIQQGPNAQNGAILDWGGNPAHPFSTLTVTGDTITTGLSYHAPILIADRLGSGVTESGNFLYGVGGGSGDTVLPAAPVVPATHPWENPQAFVWSGGTATDGRATANWKISSGGSLTAAPSMPTPGSTALIPAGATVDLLPVPFGVTTLTGNAVTLATGATLELGGMTLDTASSVAAATARVNILANELNQGTLTADQPAATLAVALAAGTLANAGALLATGGGTLSVTGPGALDNHGVLLARAGMLRVNATLTGTGAIGIESGGAEIVQAAPSSQTALFLNNDGTLTLDAPQTFTAAILDLQSGDAVDLPGITPGSLTLGGFDVLHPGILTLAAPGLSAALRLPGLALADFAAPVSDGHGGALLTTVPTVKNPIWQAATSGDWATAAQWSTGAAPGINDAAVIAAAGTPYVVTATNQSASSLVLLSAAATLQVQAGLTIAGDIIEAAGTLAVNNAASVSAAGLLQTGAAGEFDLLQGSALTLSGPDGLDIEGRATADSAALNVTGGITENGYAWFGGTSVSTDSTSVGGILTIDGSGWTDRNSATALHVGDGATGTLAVIFGASLNEIGSAIVGAHGGSGTVTVGGNASWTIGGNLTLGAGGTGSVNDTVLGTSGGTGVGHVSVGGTLLLGASGAFSVTNGASARTGSLHMTAGAGVTADSASVLEVGGTSAPVGGVVIDAGATLDGAGSITGGLLDNGLIAADASGGTLALAGPLLGAGQASIAAGAVLQLGSNAGAGVTIAFAPTSATLQLLTPAGVLAHLSGVNPASTIDMPGLAFAGLVSPSLSYDGAAGVLSFSNAGTTAASLGIGTGYAGEKFVLQADPAGGTAIVACFRAGTCIATADGELPVEALRAGMQVRLADGGSAPVVWLGHRRIDCRRHPSPQDVMPIRVHAHAFSANQPARDLWLSPDHAVYLWGRLIPIRCLVNGATIVRETVKSVTYYHVELPRHAVILAEGLAVESYLDLGNRAAFENGGGAIVLHPDFHARIWAENSCAELIFGGSVLAAARARLILQAEWLGHARTAVPDLHVRVDGRTILPEAAGSAARFVLPPGTARLRLCSGLCIPGTVAPEREQTADHGVAVAALLLDRQPLGWADPRLGAGWHAPEADCRWTGGDAEIEVDGARELIVQLAGTGHYWAAEERAQICRDVKLRKCRGSTHGSPSERA